MMMVSSSLSLSPSRFGSTISLSHPKQLISPPSSSNFIPRVSSSSSPSPSPSIAPDKEDQSEAQPQSTSSTSGCKACGKEEPEGGCNGEGRIQGGIAMVPGFGWWPIKAYRPCPAFVASGGRYKRTGQTLDEVAGSGRVDRVLLTPSSNQKQGSGKSKKK